MKTPFKQIFDEFDQNKDNKVSKKEFIKAIKKLGLGFTNDDLEKIYDAVDVNEDGSLDYQEFANAFEVSFDKLMRGYKINENIITELFKRRRQLQSIFKYFDNNGMHKLRNDIFGDAIKAVFDFYYVDFTETDIKEIIKYVDKNGDDYVEYEEFCNAFKVVDIDTKKI